MRYNYLQVEMIPGPLPLGVAVIDLSVTLFGQIFPRVANKHRLQMLDHFSECIKHTKSGRQEAIQMNVFTAVLSGLKGLNEAKTGFGQEDVKKSATNLIIVSITRVEHELFHHPREIIMRNNLHSRAHWSAAILFCDGQRAKRSAEWLK